MIFGFKEIKSVNAIITFKELCYEQIRAKIWEYTNSGGLYECKK